ncbi:MAG: hypothetical protein ACR2QJ_14650 [Geminicoccaceae bacterium]
MRKAVFVLLSLSLWLPSTASAITFDFETISVENGPAEFSASLRIDDTEDFFAEATIFNDQGFLSVDTASSPNFVDLNLSYSFAGGTREIFLTNGGVAIASPDNDDIIISGSFDGSSGMIHSTTEFGFIADAPTFLGLWTIRFGTDNLFITPPILTGRFVSDDLVSVSEPIGLATLLFGAMLIWSFRSRQHAVEQAGCEAAVVTAR